MSGMTIVGNLVRDFEERTTANGKVLGSNTVAFNRRWRAGDDWKEETDYYSITIWGEQQVANAIESLGKGDRVIVTGKMKSRPAERETSGDPIKVTYWELTVDEIGPALRWASVGTIERNPHPGGKSGTSGNNTPKTTAAWGNDPEPDF